MDLFQLMASDDELRQKALDRLEVIVAQFESDDSDIRREALERAQAFCANEWESYQDGIEALAARVEKRATDESAHNRAELLRREAAKPGTILRLTQQRLDEMGQVSAEKRAVIARYGSLQAALSPSPLEQMFIDAAKHLPEDCDEHSAAMAVAAAQVMPLPDTIADARAEALIWVHREDELLILTEDEQAAQLPVACKARHILVRDLWAMKLPVRDVAELDARLEYWCSFGGADGRGYAVIQAGLRMLLENGFAAASIETTKAKCRRLKHEHPEWSLARIGKEVGISRQAVHKHLQS